MSGLWPASESPGKAMFNPNVRFCSQCAAQMVARRPAGDAHERMVCMRCDYVDYQNPKILVSCLATLGDKLLWMRRKVAPKAGYWALPAGFMELGESPEQAAARELWEETRARISPRSLRLFIIGSLSLPHLSEVYLAYRGELESADDIAATEESMEVGLFTQDEAPWGKLAFPVVTESIRQFYLDHARGDYGVYQGHYTGESYTLRR